MHQNIRDDKELFRNIGIITKGLLFIAWIVPSSLVKRVVYSCLGAKIGKKVYFGPGGLLISRNYHSVTIGDGVCIAPGVMIFVDTLSIGDYTNIGYQCLLDGETLLMGKRGNISNRAFIECRYAPVILEDDVGIAASAIISSHDGTFRHAKGLELKKARIIVKNHAAIGNNAIILPGIQIGERAIVGAGSVVTKNVSDDDVVAGVPAKSIRKS
jgi:UDP-2-acetamido-3-amino-2,3-dideoxy-glucuronate N-acetyltransferase